MIKQIKIFEEYNQRKINAFLKKNGGNIVNYNPIVIEYDLIEDTSYIKIPNVTYSGVGVLLKAYPNFHCYDNDGEGMHYIETMINEVLFFANEIVFLADTEPIMKWFTKNDVLYDSKYDEIFHADIIEINGKSVNSKNLTDILIANNIAPKEYHIGYNTRTQFFNRLGKAVENVAISINNHGNKVEHGLNNIAKQIQLASDMQVKNKKKFIVIS